MKCNVGKYDRISRLVIGTVFVLIGASLPDLALSWRIALFVIATIAIVTAAVRFCPANALFGINTCDQQRSDRPEAEQF
jgi:NhaP-type Na+/H+ or K+/H+ antiporter